MIFMLCLITLSRNTRKCRIENTNIYITKTNNLENLEKGKEKKSILTISRMELTSLSKSEEESVEEAGDSLSKVLKDVDPDK